MPTSIDPYRIVAGWSSLWLVYNFTLLVLSVGVLYILHLHMPLSWLEALVGVLVVGFAANIAFLLGPSIELLWCWLFAEAENKILRWVLFGLGYGFSTSLLVAIIVFGAKHSGFF